MAAGLGQQVSLLEEFKGGIKLFFLKENHGNQVAELTQFVRCLEILLRVLTIGGFLDHEHFLEHSQSLQIFVLLLELLRLLVKLHQFLSNWVHNNKLINIYIHLQNGIIILNHNMPGP